MIFFDGSTYEFEDIEKDIQRNYVGDNKDLILELIRSIFFVQEGLFVDNGNLEALLINSAYEKMVGVDGNKLIGMKSDDLVQEQIIEKSVAVKAHKTKQVETILQHQINGKPLVVTATPLLDENGEVYRIVSSIKDLSMLEMYQDLLKKDKLLEGYKHTMQVQNKRNIGEIIAESDKMKDVVNFAEKVAGNDSTILILGESGVGKGLIVQLIHTLSQRGSSHMVSINCGSIPEQLLESELFGYVSGSFTGAHKQGKIGLIEAAEGGTVFLDEIGELPISLQPKLLTFLETGEITKVGSTKSTKVDVRIIAATNKDLKKMVEDGDFREDLFYRLNVIPITVPPLRERKDDITPLILHFMNKANRKNGLNKTMSPQVISMFMNYDWPGNVRELRNMIERLTVLSAGKEIVVDDFQEDEFTNVSKKSLEVSQLPVSLTDITKKIEDEYIDKAIREGGSIRAAAKLLGITPSMLYRKINRD